MMIACTPTAGRGLPRSSVTRDRLTTDGHVRVTGTSSPASSLPTRVLVGLATRGQGWSPLQREPWGVVMGRQLATFAALAALLSLDQAQAAPVINEVQVSTSGTDWEFFELAGEPVAAPRCRRRAAVSGS